MSLLSDRQIRRLCVPPTFLMYDSADEKLPPVPISPPYSEYEYSLINALNLRASGTPSPYRHYVRKVSEPLLDFEGMLTPFNPTLVRQVADEKVISFGLSSYGYDVTIAPEFKIASPVFGSNVFDPKAVDERHFVDRHGDYVDVPPYHFALARTKEYFRMPNDVTGMVLTKSTYGRMGLMCLTTVIEAGWHGELVLEYFNMFPVPVRMYAHEGGAQILFLKGEPCDAPYDDTRKYQGQRGITLPKI